MATTYATGKSRLIEPEHAAFQDQWDVPCNSNFAVTDALVSGLTIIDAATITAGSPSKTLVFDIFPATIPPVTDPLANPLAGQNFCVRIVNNLVVNMTLFIPQGIKGFWMIDNKTTGSFAVTVKTNAALSSGIVAAQGKSTLVYSDGTNVIFCDDGTSPPIATSTSYGIVTQGPLPGNVPVLETYAPTPTVGKTPASNDKYIISTGDPDPAQGTQNWLWMKV